MEKIPFTTKNISLATKKSYGNLNLEFNNADKQITLTAKNISLATNF
jgi:hypothetical protein